MLVSTSAHRSSTAVQASAARAITQPALCPEFPLGGASSDRFTPTAQGAKRAEAPKKLDVDADALDRNIASFLESAPGALDASTGQRVTAAVSALLCEGRRLYARNPDYVPMSILATSDKVERARRADSLHEGVSQEHLDVPLANFGVVAEGRLYRGAQPSQAGLEWLSAHGVKTVVTLRCRDVEDHYGYVDFSSSQEAEACQRAGLKLVEIPFTDNTVPTPAQVERFLDVMADPKSGPVYVHCAAGAGRTGVMSGIFERQQGVPMSKVEDQLVHHYMNPKSPQGAAQLAYVKSYPVKPAAESAVDAQQKSHQGWIFC
ncbi:MAG: hypothetical protein EB084_10805 [Proteobacteria bacterium]|nr:hypothetical protein [Pseudomonadota bacterium]